MIQLLGIKIIDRIKEAGLTQKILSSYSGSIVTRLGFHEVTDSVCSREAYIILHLKGSNGQLDNLRADLEAVGGIVLRAVYFSENKFEISGEGRLEVICLLARQNAADILQVQKILTSFGCNIRTRLGVNESFFGEPAGLIILELKGDDEQRELLARHLQEKEGLHIRLMRF